MWLSTGRSSPFRSYFSLCVRKQGWRRDETFLGDVTPKMHCGAGWRDHGGRGQNVGSRGCGQTGDWEQDSCGSEDFLEQRVEGRVV